MADTKSVPMPVNRHWYYLYRRRRVRRHHSTSREILAGQMLSLAGSLEAGYFLEIGKEHIAFVAGAFLILPGIFDLGGSIAGALAAKLAHRLEQSKRPVHHILLSTIGFSLAVAFVSSIFLGLFGAALATWLFDANFIEILLITIVASTIVASIGFPLIGLATIRVYRTGIDPDNVIGPIETSLFDSLTIIALLVAIGVIT
jgi:mgtE-like transporter